MTLTVDQTVRHATSRAEQKAFRRHIEGAALEIRPADRQRRAMTLYKNRDWLVDRDGVKQRFPIDENLYVPYETILDTLGPEPGSLFDWPLHMAEKTWVNIDTFNDAFRVAARYHAVRLGKNLDEDLLKASCDEAVKIADRLRLGR